MRTRPGHNAQGLVISVHDLRRRAGEMREYRGVAEAPADMGIDVIGVPPASPIDLDLRLEAVSEGVLVSGIAGVQLKGECVRCLEPIEDALSVDLQELYVYPESEATQDEASKIVDETIDLEPLIRTQVVLDLPFAPVCEPDCRGLCSICGANLNNDPTHAHEAVIDARWAALQGLAAGLEIDETKN